MTDNPAPYDHDHAVAATADATRVAIEHAGGLGRYVGEVLGSAPHELMDIVSMHIRAFKIRSAIRLYGGTKQRLEAAGLKLDDLRSPSASIEVPLLEAAIMEDREGLTELWEKLLAAAIAPVSRNRVRVRHIEILKKLEPLDAKLLESFDVIMGFSQSIITPQIFVSLAKRSLHNFTEDDLATSFDALAELNLIDTGMDINRNVRTRNPSLTPQGKNFLSVIRS